jgi:hypothetical protein
MGDPEDWKNLHTSACMCTKVGLRGSQHGLKAHMEGERQSADCHEALTKHSSIEATQHACKCLPLRVPQQ